MVSSLERNGPVSTSLGTNCTGTSADHPEAPQTAQLHSGSSTASQTKPSGAAWTLTLNKKAVSPLPLVMFLPVPSTSAKGSVPSPQNQVSEATESSLASAHSDEIPLNPTSRCMKTEPAKPEQLLNNASSIPATKLLIPLTMKISSKLRLSMSEQPESDVDVKPVLDIPQDTTETKDRKAGLPSVKTEAAAIPELPLSLVKVKTEPTEEYIEQGRQVLEDFTSKPEQLMMDNGKNLPVAGKCHSDDFGSSEMKPDITRIKKEPEPWDEDPKSSIRCLPEFSVKTDKSFKEETMRKAIKSEDQDLERFEGKDVVQCETCGKMLLETEFDQHSKEH